MTFWSSMQAMTLTGPPQRPQTSMSIREHTFQALGPGHTRQSGAGSGGMALGGCADFCVGVGLDASPAPGRRHEPASAMVRREDAMITGEIDPRLWYQGC